MRVVCNTLNSNKIVPDSQHFKGINSFGKYITSQLRVPGGLYNACGLYIVLCFSGLLVSEVVLNLKLTNMNLKGKLIFYIVM